MDDRVAWRNRWPVSLVLVGLAVWRGHRLHLRRIVNSYFVYRPVASPQTYVLEALAEQAPNVLIRQFAQPQLLFCDASD